MLTESDRVEIVFWKLKSNVFLPFLNMWQKIYIYTIIVSLDNASFNQNTMIYSHFQKQFAVTTENSALLVRDRRTL